MKEKDLDDKLFVCNYLDVGYLALECNDVSEALRCADKVLETDGESVSAWLLRMCALMLKEDVQKKRLLKLAGWLYFTLTMMKI